MKKRNNPLALTTSVLAFFLTLAGCSKPNIKDTQEPVKTSETIEISSNKEENAQPTEVVKGKTGELFVRKSAVYVPETATLRYTDDKTTTNMVAYPGDNAETLGLDKDIFTVTASKEESSNLPGLNKGKYIILYSQKNTGHGAYFNVSIEDGYQIASIVINFKSNKSYSEVTVGGETVAEENGAYIIDASSFRIQNVFNNPSSASHEQVQINSVVITYEEAAKDVTKGLLTQSSLSYNYTKAINDYSDVLSRANTFALSPAEGTGYKDWESTDFTSGISYSGNCSSGNGVIKLRASDSSGIITSVNASNVARKVIVEWDLNTPDDQSILIYGKNAAYSSLSDLYGTNVQKGTLIETLFYNEKDANNKTEVTIASPYQYIGIRLNTGAKTSYITSIEIQWESAPIYSYSNVAIRFGGLMKEPLWNRLGSELVEPATIEGYGVMVSTSEYLGVNSIEARYDAAKAEHTIDEAITAICTGNNIKNFFMELTEFKTSPSEATNEQKGETSRDFYIWNLYKEISNDDLDVEYAAVAYVRTSNEIIFFNPIAASAKGLAHDLIEYDAYEDDAFDGSLYNLANVA